MLRGGEEPPGRTQQGFAADQSGEGSPSRGGVGAAWLSGSSPSVACAQDWVVAAASRQAQAHWGDLGAPCGSPQTALCPRDPHSGGTTGLEEQMHRYQARRHDFPYKLFLEQREL